jgi:7-cyano-7-deazaguanine synthase in queuosine biosynthesis
MNASNEILCATGGLDSLVAWRYLRQPRAVYFDLGNRYGANELASIRTVYPHGAVEVHRELSLGRLEQPSGLIPGRNLLIATLAATRLDPTSPGKVWLVVQKGETSAADRSRHAFELMSQAISESLGQSVTVDTPFWEMDKVAMLRWYLRAGHNPENLRLAFSCYTPSAPNTLRGCGNCGACVRKFVALTAVGIESVEMFDAPVAESESAAGYRSAVGTGKYTEEREAAIVAALGV